MKNTIDLAWKFRQAIDTAKANGKFNYRDRFSRFHNGCCDDACDLLGKYLRGKGIHTVQIQGTFRDGNPEHTTGHAWLQLDDGIIIDITGVQFRYDELFLKFNEPVYVGYVMREIVRLIGGGRHHSTMRMNPERFDITSDQKRALLRGIADVTGYIRKSNIAFGQDGAHRVYIEIPGN